MQLQLRANLGVLLKLPIVCRDVDRDATKAQQECVALVTLSPEQGDTYTKSFPSFRMQQWCCFSLMTACQRLAQKKLQRQLLPLSSMASKECHSTSTCTDNIAYAAAAPSKQTTNSQFHRQHTDLNVGQLLSTLRCHVQQQCRVNTSVSQSQLPKVPFTILKYSSQNATQDAASFMSRLKATTSQGLWRQSAASLAAKQSGETSSAPQLKPLVFWNLLPPMLCDADHHAVLHRPPCCITQTLYMHHSNVDALLYKPIMHHANDHALLLKMHAELLRVRCASDSVGCSSLSHN